MIDEDYNMMDDDHNIMDVLLRRRAERQWQWIALKVSHIGGYFHTFLTPSSSRRVEASLEKGRTWRPNIGPREILTSPPSITAGRGGGDVPHMKATLW